MYSILIIPIVAVGISQISKFFISSNKLKPSLKNLMAYSGMPSGHSAMVVSLTTIIALELGISSPFFALSFFLTLIVLRDALGLRQYLGQQGKVINILLDDLKDDDVLERRYPFLLEKIGHTPAQVAAGSLIGILVSFFGFLIKNFL